MTMEKKILLIEGMTCVNCQNRVEQALRNMAGISKVQVSYSNGQAEIEFDGDILTLESIIDIIQNLDYTVIQKEKYIIRKLAVQ
ncbi:MAG: heavy-metal-associated domain-containing protein [Coprococcus sp.]